nr:hypothetical protein CFP56_10575 [Quercus suber]
MLLTQPFTSISDVLHVSKWTARCHSRALERHGEVRLISCLPGYDKETKRDFVVITENRHPNELPCPISWGRAGQHTLVYWSFQNALKVIKAEDPQLPFIDIHIKGYVLSQVRIEHITSSGQRSCSPPPFTPDDLGVMVAIPAA